MTQRADVPYVPKVYERFRHDFPDVGRAYDALSDATHRAGPLNDRTRRLVKLAIAVGAEAEGAVRSHVRKALADGITREEIEHALLLGLPTVGLATTVAAVGWAREVFEATG